MWVVENHVFGCLLLPLTGASQEREAGDPVFVEKSPWTNLSQVSDPSSIARLFLGVLLLADAMIILRRWQLGVMVALL